MQFQVNTPQSMGAAIAIKESRKASKRKADRASDIEPTTKKQKVLHDSVAPAAAQAAVQSQGHTTTVSGTNEEAPTLTDACQPPAQIHSHNATDFGSADDGNKKRKLESSPVDSIQVAQVHNATDVEPATKKQKLSYANLPSGRVQKSISSEESARTHSRLWRRRLESWCGKRGYDWQLLSRLPDDVLTDPNFQPQEYMDALNVTNKSLAENLTPASPVAEVHEPADPPYLTNEFLNESWSFSSVESTLRNPICDPSDLNVVSDTGDASSDRSAFSNSTPNVTNDTAATTLNQNVSVSSERDTGRDTPPRSEQTAPLSPNSTLRDSYTNVSSSRTPSVDPPRNRGGRPRGRKPRAAKPLKTPKGPMRFQKNHPVKAAVNVDIWENILSFCPPDFLLKARTVSSTFRSVLKDDSPIWKISRVKHFGSDMPDPPSGLSERQYADLLTGTGCQTRGCNSKKTRKTYWAFQKRLCMDCFRQAFLPPRALRRVYKELEISESPQYRSIAEYYQSMEEFLPALKFDRWDNYQWLGDYDPTPVWGQLYRSGQYSAFPAAAYATFSSELADFVGNEYDKVQGRFSSNKPMPGKTCPPQDEVDAWFDMKRAINIFHVPELQAVENWSETYKRNNHALCKDLRKNRETFYEEQAELAGFDKSDLKGYDSYKAAIAISKPATMQSWKILLPKLKAEREAKNLKEMQAVERDVESELNYDWSAEEWNNHKRSTYRAWEV